MKTKSDHTFKVEMEIDGKSYPLNTDPIDIFTQMVMENIGAEKEKAVQAFLYAHGWDGEDQEQAKRIAEDYVIVEYPDKTFRIMQKDEAERVYGH